MNPQDTSFGKYKYEKGKIYKLCCKDPTITEIYIGSTLNQYRRKHEHKGTCNNPNNRRYNLYVYQFIRENGGFENWDLVILEEYPTENKNELVWKEREYIELLKPALNCVKRPIITVEEKSEQNRELERKRRENNPDKFRERSRRYRENNPEKISEKGRRYRENNKQKISEYQKKHYENNKEKISEKGKERVNCNICNKEFARWSLSRHKKRIHST